jgi:hypothetical protein
MARLHVVCRGSMEEEPTGAKVTLALDGNGGQASQYLKAVTLNANQFWCMHRLARVILQHV